LLSLLLLSGATDATVGDADGVDNGDGLIVINDANELCDADDDVDAGVVDVGVADGTDGPTSAGHNSRSERRAADANRGISSSEHAIIYSTYYRMDNTESTNKARQCLGTINVIWWFGYVIGVPMAG
jgi:hypothetical protein